jgi:hypothetical protein
MKNFICLFIPVFVLLFGCSETKIGNNNTTETTKNNISGALNYSTAENTEIWNCYNWDTGNVIPTGWIDSLSNEDSMASVGYVANGEYTYISSGTKQAAFRYKFSNTFASGSKISFAFKAKTNYAATELEKKSWTWSFQNSIRAQIELKTNKITLSSATGSNLATYAFDTTSYHTYYITINFTSDTSAVVSVYIDGSTTAAMTATATTTVAASVKEMVLGCYNKTSVYKGSITWFFWSTECAEAPGSITLPAGYTL